jgi:1-acyl-sn-glycerol-3-phosphate acyltransferase
MAGGRLDGDGPSRARGVPTPVLDLFRPGIHALCRAYFGLELVGVGHIPTTGPLIITPNHQTYADPLLVSIPVRRRLHCMAWSRLFEMPGLGPLIRLLRAFPVRTESRDPRATREAVRLLQAGQVVMVFPEGERSRDGRVQPFKPGAFRLAASLATPVMAVTIAGGHDAWPPGRVLPRRGRLTITYHPLLHPDPALEPREAARDLAARACAAVVSALPEAATRSPLIPARAWLRKA